MSAPAGKVSNIFDARVQRLLRRAAVTVRTIKALNAVTDENRQEMQAIALRWEELAELAKSSSMTPAQLLLEGETLLRRADAIADRGSR